MLKYRLLFGSLMALFFLAVVLFGGWLDGSVTFSKLDDKDVQGTLLCILVAVMVIPGQVELSRLASSNNLKVFPVIASIGSVMFSTSWYWPQLFNISPLAYWGFICVFYLAALLFYQHLRHGNSGVFANCGANCFATLYLGVLGGFCLGLRIDFGLWPFLMFVCVVKCSDIGAYAIGRLFGKHKFSPKISPGKTWEGLAGAMLLAMIVSICFAMVSDIMNWIAAAIFGICFAFIGQMGDLAESMIKRDAEQKDSGDNVPGFGGVLDIVDSPLAAAPFAYLFFMLALTGS
jgi:phosphatidate cytidylyltransferase